MPRQAPKDLYGARAHAPAPEASDEPNETLRLTQMRDRLASLSNEARSIRAQVPHEFEPDVERIQQQMHRLGERLSELSAGALYHGRGGETSESAQAGSATVSDEVILLGGAKSDDPWDADTANALTRFYESGAANETGDTQGAPSSNAGGAAEAGRPVVAVEPAWLDRRFAEIAERIEQSLAEIRPESSLLTIGRRFDQLEMRMASALRGVAMRTDIEELRVAEAQIEDIGSQLNQLRRQLGRLDTIDAHLTTLTAQLSDEHLAKMFDRSESLARDRARLEAIDSQLATIAAQLSHDRLSDLVNESVSRGANLEGLAESAAQKAAAHIADQGLLEAQARDIGEVRGLIENLINERRHSDENNASMLDTMQQAIVRILDRVEALEVSGPKDDAASRPVPAPAVAAPMSLAASAAEPPATAVSLTGPARTKDTAIEEPQAKEPEGEAMPSDARYEPPLVAGMGAPRDDETFLPEEPEEPAPDFETAPFSMDAAFGGSREAEASQPETSPPARRMNVLREDFIADAHRAKLKAASKVESGGEPDQARTSEGGMPAETAATLPPKSRARRSFFKSPRIMMSILVLLAMIPAALFFMPRTPVDGATDAESAGSVFPASDGMSGLGAAQDGAAQAEPAVPAAPEGNGTGAASEDLPSKQSQQLAPQAAPEAGRYQDVGVPGGTASYDRVDTGALPDGITMDPDAEPAAGRLVTRHSDGRVSESASGFGVSATQAALMQERLLRENPADAGEGQSDGKTLAMPPVMVGPFSLRLAAAQGKPSAQYEVGQRLAEGKGPDQNLKEAAQWFRRSAASGFAMAQFRLGTLYERGVGVKADLKRAKIWYSRAAEQGNVKAMHNLAVLIAGRGGDYATALRWFTAAAERGLADSQYNLAVLYENGMGIAKDETEAYKWLLLAAKSGDSEATSRRDALKARLSDADRAQAEAAVASWQVKPVNPVANDAGLAGQAWRRHPQLPSSNG